MKPQNEKEENPFFDKRDENYRCIESESHFFEFFSSKRDKCSLRITDTIIFQNGRPTKWFFTSSKDTSEKVMMKNTDKLSVYKIVGHFSGLNKQSDGLNPLQIVDQLKNEPAAHVLTNFIKFDNKEKFQVTPLEIAKLLHDRSNSVECIQGIVHLKSATLASRETHYCEYRNDPNQVGPLYRFFKKSFFVGKRKELKTLQRQEVKTSNIYQEPKEKAPINKLWSVYESSKEYPILARTHIDYAFSGHNEHPYLLSSLKKNYEAERNLDVRVQREIERGYINKLTKTNIIMSHDQILNRKLEDSTRSFVRFIEGAYKIKVRKFVLKFLLDKDGNTVFIGGREFYFDLAPNSEYDHVAVGKYLGSKIVYESLVSLTQHSHKERAKQVIYRDPYAIKGTRSKSDALESSRKRPISAALYQKMLIKECAGDFCDFFVNNPEKANLGIEDRAMATDAAYKSKLYKRVNLHEITNKPFEITTVLKMKCRERVDELVPVLKQNHILPLQLKGQIYGYNYDEYDPIYFQQLLEQFSQRKRVENIDGLYSNLRICNTCFTVYALAMKYFDANEQPDENYYKFNQRYSKVGNIGIHPTSRRETEQSRRVTETRESAKGSFLLDATRLRTRQSTRGDTRQSVRPITSRESMWDRMRTDTSRLATEPAGKDYEDPTNKSMALKFKLNLSKALKTEAGDDDETGFFTRIATEAYDREPKQTDESFPDIGRRRTPEIRVRASSSKRKDETDRPRKGSLMSRTKQSISCNRMKMGLLSFVGTNIEPTADELTATYDRGDAKYVNIYELLSDNPPKPKMNLGGDKNRALLIGQKERSAPTVDAKRASMFEGLIKNIHIENAERDAKVLLDEKTRAAELSSNPRFRSSSAHLIEQLKKLNKNALAPTRVDAMYTGVKLLRQIQPNKISTTKVPFDLKAAREFEPLKSIPLEQYCSKIKIQPPQIEKLKELFFFLYDTSVGIPYCVIESDVLVEGQLRNLIVCNDLFDNFIDHLNIYKKFANEHDNLRIILFNLPGQAYSAYNPSTAYNNELCSSIVDSLLFHLDETKKMSFARESVYLVGFGYGGNILAFLMHNSEDLVPSIKSLMIVNGFTRVDEMINGMLEEMEKTLSTCPAEMIDLPYNYYSILCGGSSYDRTEINKKVKSNPISIPGRLAIIRGMKESIDLTRQVKAIRTPLFIVHSMKNCFIPVENVDRMLETSRELDYIYEQRASTNLKAKLRLEPPSGNSYMRKNFYYDGPHNILEQKPRDALKILKDFLVYLK